MASASGYMLRRDQALDAAGEELCDCAHPRREHREHGYSWELVDGEIIEIVHPRHRPGLFACRVEGCSCEVQH